MPKIKRKTMTNDYWTMENNFKFISSDINEPVKKSICRVKSAKDLPKSIEKMKLSKTRAYRLKQAIIKLENEPISEIRRKTKKLNLGTEREVFVFPVSIDMSILIGFDDDNSQIYLYDVIDKRHM